MLPDIRQNDDLFEVPLFDIQKDGIDNFLDELLGFHQNFED